MSVARFAREKKRRLGQFFTPPATAQAIVDQIDILPAHRVLEPSFGEGAFVFAVAEAMRRRLGAQEMPRWCARRLHGCELDDVAYAQFQEKWRQLNLGAAPAAMEHADFFTWMPPGIDRAIATDKKRYFAANIERFDLIIGNPPFGGSIQPSIQDRLDAVLGMREGRKIKKETYSFFIVKSLDLLNPGGRLVFICSDTLLTISTMTGLRAWLQKNYTVNISEVPGLFADTAQDMALIDIKKQPSPARQVTVFGAALPFSEIDITPNRSWRARGEYTKYFTGAFVGDKMTATSGMTIGKNELFVRRIRDGHIEEPYRFYFEQEPVTLEKALARARLGKLSEQSRKKISEAESRGITETVVKWEALAAPAAIKLPHPDYKYYNKASSKILYAAPEWVVFWRDSGRYVYTFKNNSSWYLHGVGGKKYFEREGLTWALVASRLYTRYLPAGYILDSGAPCAFLRPGVPHQELFFIMGWSLTRLCNRILKEVLNHTRNNQGKDVERLPYPVWVPAERKNQAIKFVKALVKSAMARQVFSFNIPELEALDDLYAWPAAADGMKFRKQPPSHQPPLL